VGPAQSGSLPRSGHIDHVPALVTELLMNGQDTTGDAAASIGDVVGVFDVRQPGRRPGALRNRCDRHYLRLTGLIKSEVSDGSP
jgi:hypothetical protein